MVKFLLHESLVLLKTLNLFQVPNIRRSYLYNDTNPEVKAPIRVPRSAHVDNALDEVSITELVVPLQMETGLLPVSRRGAGAGGELDRQMAVTELHIEVGRQALEINIKIKSIETSSIVP